MLRLAADKTGDSSARTALIDAAQSMHERAQTFRALQAPRGDKVRSISRTILRLFAKFYPPLALRALA
jgi:hypothetical protein